MTILQTNLVDATEELIAAIVSEDFAAISRGIAERESAIAEFVRCEPTQEALEMGRRAEIAGQQAARMLASLKRRAAFENTRLEQIQEGFVRGIPRSRPRVDLQA